MAEVILSHRGGVVKLKRVFRLLGRFQDTGKVFFAKRVLVLEDKRDYIFLGVSPEEHCFKQIEIAIAEYYQRVF